MNTPIEKTMVTEAIIVPIKSKNGLVALASCVVDNKFYINSIGLYTKLEGGYRLTYPNKKTKKGSSMNIFHPINKECGDAIEKAIIDEYEKLMIKDLD